MQNIIATVFDVESEGFQAITTLRNRALTENYAIMEMALVKKIGNTLSICDSFSSEVLTSDDTIHGGIIGSLIGVIGGPIGVLLGGSAGALTGSLIDTKDAERNASMLEMVAGKLGDREISLIILADEADEGSLDPELDRYKATIIRFDAATIAVEVEEAQKMQKELERQARVRLREQKKEEHKQEIESKRAKLAADFEGLKSRLKKN